MQFIRTKFKVVAGLSVTHRGDASPDLALHRRVSRQPAASASSTEQNQRVPLLMCILICAYQRLVGLW